jgi:hypothetical protein
MPGDLCSIVFSNFKGGVAQTVNQLSGVCKKEKAICIFIQTTHIKPSFAFFRLGKKIIDSFPVVRVAGRGHHAGCLIQDKAGDIFCRKKHPLAPEFYNVFSRIYTYRGIVKELAVHPHQAPAD